MRRPIIQAKSELKEKVNELEVRAQSAQALADNARIARDREEEELAKLISDKKVADKEVVATNKTKVKAEKDLAAIVKLRDKTQADLDALVREKLANSRELEALEEDRAKVEREYARMMSELLAAHEKKKDELQMNLLGLDEIREGKEDELLHVGKKITEAVQRLSDVKGEIEEYEQAAVVAKESLEVWDKKEMDYKGLVEDYNGLLAMIEDAKGELKNVQKEVEDKKEEVKNSLEELKKKEEEIDKKIAKNKKVEEAINLRAEKIRKLKEKDEIESVISSKLN